MEAPSWNQTVLLVSSDIEVKGRVASAFKDETQFIHATNTQMAIEIIGNQSINVLILDAKTTDPTKTFYDEFYQEKSEVPYIELSQYAGQLNNGVTIILLVDKMQIKDGEFARKCGAVLIMDRKEINNNQMVYLIEVLRKRTFRTILTKDVNASDVFAADIYHYLPLSNRYALFLAKNEVLTHDKVYKIIESNVRHLYVKESDLPTFFSSLKVPKEETFSGQLAKIRGLYKQLLIEIFDLSSDSKIHIGKKIQGAFHNIAHQIIDLTNRFNDPIECINKLPYPRFSVIAHSINCGIYAALFAKSCNIEKVEELIFAAMIHNLGLYHIAPETLNKTEEEMSAGEFKEYQKHPFYTVEALRKKGIAIDPFIEGLILNHHENYDGTGYPQGLASENVGLENSLISLIGSFDYYNSIRPNEKPTDGKKAWEKIKHDHHHSTTLGRKFHPELINRLDVVLFK